MIKYSSYRLISFANKIEKKYDLKKEASPVVVAAAMFLVYAIISKYHSDMANFWSKESDNFNFNCDELLNNVNEIISQLEEAKQPTVIEGISNSIKDTFSDLLPGNLAQKKDNMVRLEIDQDINTMSKLSSSVVNIKDLFKNISSFCASRAADETVKVYLRQKESKEDVIDTLIEISSRLKANVEELSKNAYYLNQVRGVIDRRFKDDFFSEILSATGLGKSTKLYLTNVISGSGGLVTRMENISNVIQGTFIPAFDAAIKKLDAEIKASKVPQSAPPEAKQNASIQQTKTDNSKKLNAINPKKRRNLRVRKPLAVNAPQTKSQQQVKPKDA
jgi:hypothetical protein